MFIEVVVRMYEHVFRSCIYCIKYNYSSGGASERKISVVLGGNFHESTCSSLGTARTSRTPSDSNIPYVLAWEASLFKQFHYSVVVVIHYVFFGMAIIG